jgi:hypothetical protein
MFDSAMELKEGLDERWGVSKYLQAHEYRKAASDAYRFAKVAFYNFPDAISHRSIHRSYQTETEMKPSLAVHLILDRHLVSSAFH